MRTIDAHRLSQARGVSLRPAGNIVIVSHKANIMDAFGPRTGSTSAKGEASVFSRTAIGVYKFIVRIQANEWSKLAQESNDGARQAFGWPNADC